MQKEEIRNKIKSAFSQVQYPGDKHIAYHQCDECERVRGDFRGQSPASLKNEIIEYHYDSIPLFAPKAYQFFLPVYLYYALDNFDSDVTQFLLFNLGSNNEERLKLFSLEQKQAVAAFLQYIQSIDEHGEYQEETKDALEIWQTAS